MKAQPADVFRQAENIVTRKVMDETLLVPISGQLASMDNLYTLNETGAFIWQALDGVRSLAEISEMLERQYDAPAEVIAADVLEIADGLAEAGLIVADVNS
ncbi:PqqD family protein [Candidatus Electronema sp. JC]|uniref:PqqD family protein n=1 Tax=Candidatus Electronema sp. JC TaxID=3401570 RepID=UPI003B42D4F7